MNNEPTPDSAILPAAKSIQAPSEPSGVHKVFLGPDGLRAGWRLAIYLAFVVGLQYLIVQRGLRLIPGVAEIMKRVERRSFGVYGLPLEGAFGKLFWQGALWGLGFESLEMLAIFALGGYSFGGLALAGVALLKYAVFWAIGFVLVGIFEEFLFRGYAQFTLGSGIGFWPAAFLLSAA